MEALGAYRSDSDEEVPVTGAGAAQPPAQVPAAQSAVEASDSEDETPDASDAFGLQHAAARERALISQDASTAESTAAPAVEDRPETRVVSASAPALPGEKTLSGYVEATTMSDFDFRNQQRTFEMLGYARNPSEYAAESSGSQAFVGDKAAAQRMGGATMAELRGGTGDTRSASRAHKRRRKGQNGDPSVFEGPGAYLGPWGGWEDETEKAEAQPEPQPAADVGPTAAEVAAAEAAAARRKQEAEKFELRRQLDEAHGSEKSILHIPSMYDYQGRTYMDTPTDTDTNLRGEAGDQECFIPEMCIHTFTGHTKGISALRLFPQTGHLLLSGSMDTKVKLWDVYHQGNCLRTFLGHSRAVRDVTFSNDGRRFLSAGLDNYVKLWDTESGACLRAVTTTDTPNVVRFNPDEDKQNIFMVGTNDRKIMQFDANTGELTQQYGQHLGAVNTITFVDDNRRFVSTSDDKSLRAWDFDIPVAIRYVADPLMHSMPAATLHPSGRWIACQAMNNAIQVFNAETFKQSRRSYRGHTIAGYACQVGFSPDGRFISSGDSSGQVVFWDWKSGKLLTRLDAHKDVVITHEWLPHETSKMVTGAWDGLIKLWT